MSQTQNSNTKKVVSIRIFEPVAVNSVIINSINSINVVWKIIPIIINNKTYNLFIKDGTIFAKNNHNIINALINMKKLAIYVNSKNATYNTPTLFKGSIEDVIILPRGISIEKERIQEFLKMIGYDKKYYLALSKSKESKEIDRIYIFNKIKELSPNIGIDNLDINEDEMERIDDIDDDIEIFYKETNIEFYTIKVKDFDNNSNNGVDVLRKSMIKIYGKQIKFANIIGYPLSPIVIFIPGSVVGKKGELFFVINDYEEEIVANIYNRKIILKPNNALIIYARKKQ